MKIGPINPPIWRAMKRKRGGHQKRNSSEVSGRARGLVKWNGMVNMEGWLVKIG